MKKWEYCYVNLMYVNKGKEEMNKLGAEGWELVSVNNSIAYFKREDHKAK